MIMRGDAGEILLQGQCPVEEAETLLGLLLAEPGAVVDWSGCTKAHTAVAQVLLALRPPVRGTCRDVFMARWIAPSLATAG
jgi:hypothetical protein